MIVTEQQRRWWFATHPEYSSSRERTRPHVHSEEGHEDEETGKLIPEEVDASVDEALKYERDPVGIALLKSAKFWFGTEFASKTPEEQYELLWGDEETDGGGYQPLDEAADDRWPVGPPSHAAGHPGEHSKHESLRERIEREMYDDPRKEEVIRILMEEGGVSREIAEKRWEFLKRNESTALGVANAMTVHGAIALGRGLLSGAGRLLVPARTAGRSGRTPDQIGTGSATGKGAQALNAEGGQGPGEWIEVCRSRIGLEHQSRMSGQPIRESGGKYYIKEYEVNGVRFDDYRNGILYEYKGPQGKMLNREGVFYPGLRAGRQARDDALRQAEAAQGIPVIWKVGENQVEAFKRAVGRVPGIIIVP